MSAATPSQKATKKTKISRSEYLQLVGLHAIARRHMQTIQDAFDAALDLTQELDFDGNLETSGHTYTGAGAHKDGTPPGRGCDWTLRGLFHIHELEVVHENGAVTMAFVFAEPEPKEAA